MKYSLLFIILFLFSYSSSNAYSTNKILFSVMVDDSSDVAEHNLVKYYMVTLIRIPDRPKLDEALSMKIQTKHLNGIDSLYNIGKLVAAGPFADDLGGGLFFLKVETLEEAIAICENDEAIKNKRLNYEIRPWYTGKGTFSVDK